jgi:hypothetical protein
MSAALELIRTVEANGGQLRVDGEYLVIAPGDAAAPVMEGLREHKAEIIGLLESVSIPPHDPFEWAEDFHKWALARCLYRARDFGGMVALHRDFCKWEIAHDEVPCTHETFEHLVQGLGFLIADGMVSGLIFRADFEAVGL